MLALAALHQRPCNKNGFQARLRSQQMQGLHALQHHRKRVRTSAPGYDDQLVLHLEFAAHFFPAAVWLLITHVPDIMQFRSKFPVQSVLGSGVEYLLSSVDEYFVVVPADRFIRSVAFPKAPSDFRGVQNIPESQHDGWCITSPLQHLQRRKQFSPDPDGNMIYEQDLRVKNADSFLNRRHAQSLRFFQPDSQPQGKPHARVALDHRRKLDKVHAHGQLEYRSRGTTDHHQHTRVWNLAGHNRSDRRVPSQMP